jgi:hypothetical protein
LGRADERADIGPALFFQSINQHIQKALNDYEERDLEIHHSDGHQHSHGHRHHAGRDLVHGRHLRNGKENQAVRVGIPTEGMPAFFFCVTPQNIALKSSKCHRK